MQTKTLNELVAIAVSDAAEEVNALREWLRRLQNELRTVEINLVPAGDSHDLEFWVGGERFREQELVSIAADDPSVVKLTTGIETLVAGGLTLAVAKSMLNTEEKRNAN